MKACPICESPYGYSTGDDSYTCPESSNEWSPKKVEMEGGIVVLDSNGTRLQNGDSVVLVKDLKIKGSSQVAKQGTAVRRISLDRENAEYIEGKVGPTLTVIITKYVKKI
mgnify:CR=1 FL=1